MEDGRATDLLLVALPVASTGVIGVGLARTTPGTVERTVTVVEDVERTVGVVTEVLQMFSRESYHRL
jgi:hypothetical protein